MADVLIVDVDPHLTDLVREALSSRGHQVTLCHSTSDARQRLSARNYPVVVIDITLPDDQGLLLCKELTTRSRPPIVLVTGKAGEPYDRIFPLEVGADDYVVKPYSPLELVARIRARLRRQALTVQSDESSLQTHGDLTIDSHQRLVAIRGRAIQLTRREFDLLSYLGSTPGRVYTREQLLNRVWGYSFVGYEHTVISTMNRLRSKLEPRFTEYIETVRGVGYRFVPQYGSSLCESLRTPAISAG